MTTKVKIERLPTGVPGLDEILGGGLPEYSFNLIGGPPGCGKTTLAHQIMFSLATRERPALYLTVLGEPPLKMLRYQQQFEFFNEAPLANRPLLNSPRRASAMQQCCVDRGEVERHSPALVSSLLPLRLEPAR